MDSETKGFWSQSCEGVSAQLIQGEKGVAEFWAPFTLLCCWAPSQVWLLPGQARSWLGI